MNSAQFLTIHYPIDLMCEFLWMLCNLNSIGDSNAPICGSNKTGCYNQAEDDMLQKFFKDGLDKTRIPDDSECNCLPSCTSIAYDAEISQAKFDWKALFAALMSSLDEYPK